MKPIERSEILPLGDYEAIRPHFRQRIIDQKRSRRLSLGEHVTAMFENRDTVLLQIQEMLRTERITSESGIAHEIATYNELVPRDAELSLTLFVEIAEKELREKMLVELAGLEEHVWLEIGGERVQARAAEREGAVPERTTAVHYYKIPLGAAELEKLARGGEATLLIDHPKYQARAALGETLTQELARDLS